jgi:hypothetical protein
MLAYTDDLALDTEQRATMSNCKAFVAIVDEQKNWSDEK